MSLVFYHSPMSTSNLTEAVLAELDVPCERVTVDLANKPAALLQINPNGRVPTIVHDGVSIWEACAITMYLGETFGVEAGLYPAPGPRRGEAMKWICWSNGSLSATAMRLFTARHRGETTVADAARGELAGLLLILDGALGAHAFLAGDDYSLADTHLHGIVSWYGSMGVDLSRANNITAWLRRCGERPALAKLLAEWREEMMTRE